MLLLPVTLPVGWCEVEVRWGVLSFVSADQFIPTGHIDIATCTYRPMSVDDVSCSTQLLICGSSRVEEQKSQWRAVAMKAE